MLNATFEFLRERKMSYNSLFRRDNPAAVAVLEDLARYCRALETCVVPNDRDKTLLLEGRREVFLRITQHMNLSVDDLYRLYGGPAQPTK